MAASGWQHFGGAWASGWDMMLALEREELGVLWVAATGGEYARYQTDAGGAAKISVHHLPGCLLSDRDSGLCARGASGCAVGRSFWA